MREFEKCFDKLARQQDASTIFTDFLDYSIDQFLINPNVKYFNHQKYDKEAYEDFFNLFHAWIMWTQRELESKEWVDCLGIFYEDIIKSKYKASGFGQFFTPSSVTDAMSQLILDNDKEEVLWCHDPTCGSGRLLLSHHAHRPFDILVGHDLDPISCKMTLLNFVIHGVKGSVAHINSLSRECFNSWKVNEFIDMGLYGIYECHDLAESELFIGVPPKTKSLEVVEKEPVASGQTTLI